MWIHTKHGFMSVVEYDPKKDPSRKKDPGKYPKVAKRGTHVLIRARVKADFEDLKKFMPSILIEDDTAADYRYRVVIPRRKFKAYMDAQIDEITYDSHFKEVVRDTIGKEQSVADGAARHRALMSIWSTMAALQPGGAYSSYGAYDYGWYGKSKYETKGKYGTKYATALGAKDGDSAYRAPVDADPWLDAELWDAADAAADRTSYNDAAVRLGLLVEITPLHLHDMIMDQDWVLCISTNEAAFFSPVADLIYKALLERHGEGSKISGDSFFDAWVSVDPQMTDLGDDEGENIPEKDIHSRPLDEPIN